jgi:hypothetical protein
LQNLQQKTKNNASGAQRGFFRRFKAGIHPLCAIFINFFRLMLLTQQACYIRGQCPPCSRVLTGAGCCRMSQ